ncbi:MAG: imidazolonepropionase [Micromonosporaceae bacterium]|nr:imidazolonepropionase [Micromonosporaceae bacterium]
MGTATGKQGVELLVVHAAELVTCRAPGGRARGEALDRLEVIRDGALAIRGERIVAVGPTAELAAHYTASTVLDATGRLVSPGFVDAHTHLVHAGSRHDEWQDLVRERPVAGIDAGIRRTLRATRAASSAELRSRALADLDVMLRHGATTVEAKSGYGLDHETELRMLSVAAALDHPVEVVPTYLGAHVLPPEYADDRAGYVDLVISLLPAARRYAAYCDIACDPISFTAAECEQIAAAAVEHGFRLRVHADQTGDASGTALAVRFGASSTDHLDEATPDAIAALAGSDTVGVLFPGVTLHMLETVPGSARPPLRSNRPAWARRLVDSGATLALSTDYNPGTSPTPSMQTVMQLAARLYRLSYAEIWHMCTINAAAALDRSAEIGSLEPGKRADVVIWSVPEHGVVIHRFGANLVDTVIVRGQTTVQGRAARAGGDGRQT